ncbi:hypothetical protein [Bradyrhizobium sp. SZCCHNS1012]|uniref:hypothetical protein n=1 Tax=Bradyrhizobium sp. SZCCHNS1012 TaxID=3057297 RepID=UPI002916D124|nr:hypothetical protein [Bradyrhizobium sp. SZCCHNS1012]
MRLTVVEIAARGICREGKKECACDAGASCVAQDLFGTVAAQAVGALRKHKLIDTAKEAELGK